MTQELVSVLSQPVIMAPIVMVMTQFIKGFIKPRFGDEGVIGFVFLLALIFSVTKHIIVPAMPEDLIFHLIKIMTGAIAIYEVLKTMLKTHESANNN